MALTTAAAAVAEDGGVVYIGIINEQLYKYPAKV